MMVKHTDPGVFIYEHVNFEGRFIHVTQSEQWLLTRNFNNIASSWCVNGDYSATLFDGPFFTGKRSFLMAGASCPDLSKGYSPLGVSGGCSGEVRNDAASSVGIGTAKLNDYASPFYWPKGSWRDKDAVAANTWIFGPDHTYVRKTRAFAAGNAFDVWGNWWERGFHPWSDIVTRNNKIRWLSGLEENYPNEDHRFRWEKGYQTIHIQMGTLLIPFHYDPRVE